MIETFHPFALERWMSLWEPQAHVNLCDSGVAPVSVRELLTMSGASLEDIADLRLPYGAHNGSRALREAIAALYPGATPDHVMVTSGSAECMFLLTWLLVGRGDRVVIPTPSYPQAYGMALNLGAHVVPLPLTISQGWEPDPDAICTAIAPGTKLVIVTNPHNPTGHAFAPPTCDAIVERAAEVGAWLIVDEIYMGAELSGVTRASMWNGYDRLIITNGLSKAYGLPGLRIGWMVGSPRLIADAWTRHDYTVLAPNIIGDFLARQALTVRDRLRVRGQQLLARNWPVLERRLQSLNAHLDGRLDWRAPHAGAFAFVRYDHRLASEEVADRLRDGWSVLVAPGDHFGGPQYLRIGLGSASSQYPHDVDVLERALLAVLG